MKLDPRLRPLMLALRKLAPEQGRIARHNARLRVKRAVRRLLAEVDATFPLERKPTKPRKLSTPSERYHRLKNEGWDDLPNDGARLERLSKLGEASIKIKRAAGIILIPAWVLDLPSTTTVAELKRYRRDVRARDAARVRAAMLRGSGA